jgi:predicted RecA/RadA family phage recombinase
MSTAEFIQNGDIVDYINSGETEVAYHEVVAFGSLIGIAQEAIPVGGIGGLAITGVHGLPTEATFVAGDSVYFNTSTGKAVAAAGDNIVYAGVAIAATAGGVVATKINVGFVSASGNDTVSGGT